MTHASNCSCEVGDTSPCRSLHARLSTHHARHPNYPDERGRGTPRPDELSSETRASMDRAWRDAEAAEERARTAADAAYQQYFKNKGGK